MDFEMFEQARMARRLFFVGLGLVTGLVAVNCLTGCSSSGRYGTRPPEQDAGAIETDASSDPGGKEHLGGHQGEDGGDALLTDSGVPTPDGAVAESDAEADASLPQGDAGAPGCLDKTWVEDSQDGCCWTGMQEALPTALTLALTGQTSGEFKLDMRAGYNMVTFKCASSDARIHVVEKPDATYDNALFSASYLSINQINSSETYFRVLPKDKCNDETPPSGFLYFSYTVEYR